MSADELFNDMRNASQSGRVEQQLSFQERIVKQLLRRAGVVLPVAASKRDAMETHGSDNLDFQWFADTYPKFPVRMLSQKMRYTQTATISCIYGKGLFQRLPWFKEYQAQAELYDIRLREERAAFVFNLPYAKDAYLMVLHNQPVQSQIIRDAELRQDEPWPRTTFPMKQHGIVCVLEAFDSFLQTVGTDWAD